MCGNKRKQSIKPWQAEYYKKFQGRLTKIFLKYFQNVINKFSS